jgi:hypothetical protein
MVMSASLDHTARRADLPHSSHHTFRLFAPAPAPVAKLIHIKFIRRRCDDWGATTLQLGIPFIV